MKHRNYLLAAILMAVMASSAHAGLFDLGGQIGNRVGGYYGNQGNAASPSPYGRSGDSYNRSGETLKAGDVADAIVISVREVTMEASSTATNVGAGAGAAVGGIAGASVGSNSTTKVLGGLLGGLAGGVVGDMAGTAVGEDKAGEIVVMLAESGKKIFIVQKDGMRFKEGQKVFVLASGGNSYGKSLNFRVAPNPSAK
jgi:outer membrane lipoprotein SlyB